MPGNFNPTDWQFGGLMEVIESAWNDLIRIAIGLREGKQSDGDWFSEIESRRIGKNVRMVESESQNLFPLKFIYIYIFKSFYDQFKNQFKQSAAKR